VRVEKTMSTIKYRLNRYAPVRESLLSKKRNTWKRKRFNAVRSIHSGSSCSENTPSTALRVSSS